MARRRVRTKQDNAIPGLPYLPDYHEITQGRIRKNSREHDSAVSCGDGSVGGNHVFPQVSTVCQRGSRIRIQADARDSTRRRSSANAPRCQYDGSFLAAADPDGSGTDGYSLCCYSVLQGTSGGPAAQGTAEEVSGCQPGATREGTPGARR